MRRVILTGAILVSAIGVTFVTGVSAASAQSPDNVCIYNSEGNPTQCMNDWYGNLGDGAQAVRFFHYGNSGGYNAIDVKYVGTIASGGLQPFTVGSDLNNRYNGDNVYELEWWRDGEDSGTCIAGYAYNANALNESCTPSSGEDQLWFVWSSYLDLISVGSSNLRYLVTETANQPVWMGSNGAGNTNNGDNVYLTTTQSNNLSWYFYTDGG